MFDFNGVVFQGHRSTWLRQALRYANLPERHDPRDATYLSNDVGLCRKAVFEKERNIPLLTSFYCRGLRFGQGCFVFWDLVNNHRTWSAHTSFIFAKFQPEEMCPWNVNRSGKMSQVEPGCSTMSQRNLWLLWDVESFESIWQCLHLVKWLSCELMVAWFLQQMWQHKWWFSPVSKIVLSHQLHHDGQWRQGWHGRIDTRIQRTHIWFLHVLNWLQRTFFPQIQKKCGDIVFLVPHRPWRRRKHFEETVFILLVKQLAENKAWETVGHCRWGKGRDGGRV